MEGRLLETRNLDFYRMGIFFVFILNIRTSEHRWVLLPVETRQTDFLPSTGHGLEDRVSTLHRQHLHEQASSGRSPLPDWPQTTSPALSLTPPISSSEVDTQIIRLTNEETEVDIPRTVCSRQLVRRLSQGVSGCLMPKPLERLTDAGWGPHRLFKPLEINQDFTLHTETVTGLTTVSRTSAITWFPAYLYFPYP